VLSQVKSRVQQTPGNGVAMRPGKVVSHRQQPRQKVERAGEDDHLILLMT
jgi:hypothetical protein